MVGFSVLAAAAARAGAGAAGRAARGAGRPWGPGAAAGAGPKRRAAAASAPGGDGGGGRMGRRRGVRGRLLRGRWEGGGGGGPTGRPAEGRIGSSCSSSSRASRLTGRGGQCMISCRIFRQLCWRHSRRLPRRT